MSRDINAAATQPENDCNNDNNAMVKEQGWVGSASNSSTRGHIKKLDKDELLEATGVFSVVVRFQAPYKICVERLPTEFGIDLLPHQILIRTDVTAVSAGTEMLVYRGRMPHDISTDATLAGEMGDQTQKPFSYPASYGYANVGRIAATGSAVSSTWSVDTVVFAFREHTSWSVADVSDVQRVPDGVTPNDATLLPNVETAISLAMDATPLPGENIAVVGQGIVGLLLVAVLRICYGTAKIIAVDSRQDRLEISKNCAGCDAVVHVVSDDPVTFQTALRAALDNDAPAVDISVDVSGAASGLDSAVRATRDGGRVVVGSWFGAQDVTLSSLGGRFHRSHMTLVASQVSAIPAHLTARWDKSRRFRLAWRILSMLKPTTTFPVHIASIKDAPQTYSEIDQGRHLQVLFRYP